MSIINYFSGVDVAVGALPAMYMASCYRFEADYDCQFIPVSIDAEVSSTIDVITISSILQDADAVVSVSYFERDSGPVSLVPAVIFSSIVTDSDEYYNGDGDNDDSFACRGNSDLTQCDLGVPHYSVSGVTKDSNSSPLGSCVVHLFDTASDVLQTFTTSDIGGNYAFQAYYPGPFYMVAYKAGSPDVAGTTVNTIMGIPV